MNPEISLLVISFATSVSALASLVSLAVACFMVGKNAK